MPNAARQSAVWALAGAALTAVLSGCGQPAAPATDVSTASPPPAVTTTQAAATRPSLEPRALLSLDSLEPAITPPADPIGAQSLSAQALPLVLSAEQKIRQKDFAGAMQLLNEASALEPGSPRVMRDIGLTQAGNGQLDQAMVNLSAAVQSAPDDLESQLWVGRLAATQRDYDRAIYALRTALLTSEAKPQDPKAAEALLRLAEALEAQGYATAALEAFDRLDQWIYQNDLIYRENPALRGILLRPERLWGQQGLLHLRLGNYPQAVARLEQARAMNLTHGPTAALLMEALARSGQTGRAMDLLEALANEPSARPQAAALSRLLVRVEANQGRPVEALRMLGDLIEAHPGVDWSTRLAVEQILHESPSAQLLARFVSECGDDLTRFSMRYVAGQLAAALGKPVTAIAQFQATIDANAEFLPAYEALLDVATQAGDQQQLAGAIAHLEAMPQESHFRHYMLGKLAVGRGDLQAALAQLREARQLDEMHVPTLLLLAMVQERAGQAPAAVETLEEAAQIAPEFAEIYATLYRLHVSARKYDRAQQAAERFMALHPSSLDGMVMLAELHILTGRPAKARQAIEDLRRAAPDDSRATLLQVRLEMGRDATTLPADAFEQSLATLRDIIRREPQNQAAGRMLAEALSKRGRHGEAAQAWGDLYRQSGDAELQRVHVAALADAKQYDDALAILRQRLEQNPSDLWAQWSLVIVLDRLGDEQQIAQSLESWLPGMTDEQTRGSYRVRLVQAYQRMGQYDRIALILDELSAGSEDPEIRQSIRVQKLRLYEQSRQYDRAMAHVQVWIADNPEDAFEARAMLMSILLEARLEPALAIEARELIAQWQATAQPIEREPMRAIDLILLGKAGQVDQALAGALEWLADEPQDISPRELALTILAQAHRHEQALTLVQQWLADLERPAALTQPATQPDAAKLLNWARRQVVSLTILTGQEELAIQRVEAMLEQDPADIRLLQLKSTALQELGRHAESLAVLEAAWDADQSDAMLANNLAYGYAVQGVNLQRAERMLRKALADDPQQVAAIDSLAWVYYKQNRLEESADLFRGLLDSGALATYGDVVMYDHAGDVFYRLGDQWLARQMWQRAAEAAKDHAPISWDERRAMAELPAKLEALDQNQPAPVAPLASQ